MTVQANIHFAPSAPLRFPIFLFINLVFVSKASDDLASIAEKGTCFGIVLSEGQPVSIDREQSVKRMKGSDPLLSSFFPTRGQGGLALDNTVME